jgi:hypothetical protein
LPALPYSTRHKPCTRDGLAMSRQRGMMPAKQEIFGVEQLDEPQF